ncbi:MAG TPA: metallophosphoesterase family protein [Bryobacteraceae bacterium]|nr:metallophosphoesterase family protein [Bryobacteraceae bacterium]
MRYLILSDIHSNWEALDAVARDARGAYDQALCCGDLVGYCGDPNAVVEWVRAHCALTIRGNHDRACAGIEELEWFNPVARAAAQWTALTLTPGNREFLRGLPKGPAKRDGFELAHGSTSDEDEYVLTPDEAFDAFSYIESRLVFFGHTHVQGGYVWNRDRVETIAGPSGRDNRMDMRMEAECAYLVNPGSVGQPRDGDPRTAFAIYNSDSGVLTYRRAAYDVEGAQRKILAAGLPEILAGRLAVGR